LNFYLSGEGAIMPKTDIIDQTPEQKKSKQDYIFAVGRRREAVARIRLYPNVKEGFSIEEQPVKAGQLFVNGQPIEAYFVDKISQSFYHEPLRVTNTLNRVAATIRVVGGGKNSQLDAIVQGLARALESFDREKFRPILKKRGFLTVDARVRQRRKVGMGGKSRRKKQSPKR